MRIRNRLTGVAVDSFADYVKERFAKIKELDLDEDGQKDVDQIIEIVNRCGEKVKDTLETTDFSNMAAGLDQIFSGIALIKGSFDATKLAALGNELADGTKQLTVLGKLTVQHLKDEKK